MVLVFNFNCDLLYFSVAEFFIVLAIPNYEFYQSEETLLA